MLLAAASADYTATLTATITMLPDDPYRSGICLGIEGTPNRPVFVIKDERAGRPISYWSGTQFTHDSRKALVFTSFTKARDEAWRLRSDYIWGWLASLLLHQN